MRFLHAGRRMAARLTTTILLAAVCLVTSVASAAERAVVAKWDFSNEETSPLKLHGGVHRDVPGPRPPVYPDFDPTNTAVSFEGSGAYLSFDDPGAGSPFDFGNGDAIGLEAWVLMESIRPGEQVYLIGKGRTEAPGFAKDNQNWALRVREVKGEAALSFLFATQRGNDSNGEAHWHRWTSTGRFAPGKLWRHVAVTYRFGEPETLRAWIDGKPVAGEWDMGGATQEAPVVDNDSVWIGSSRGGAAGNSFRGSLDAVAIHRGLLDDAAVTARFRRVGGDAPPAKPAPETPPEYPSLPNTRVLVALHEGLPAHDRWLNEGEELPAESLRYEVDAFLLDRFPQRFDAWGVRDSWKPPTLLRMAADVVIPPGQHQLIVRTKGLTRLWIDDVVVARGGAFKGTRGGEEPMTPPAKPPVAGARIAEHGLRETMATIEGDGVRRSRVVLETLVGGKAFRVDPGEVTVAIESDGGDRFHLLAAAGRSERPVELNDVDVLAALAAQERELRALDDRTRRAAAATRDAFWTQRHEFARKWIEASPGPQPPGEGHPVDAFLKARADEAVRQSAGVSMEQSRAFHTQVLPVLRESCHRCHGDIPSGGLTLTSRESALGSGHSTLSAVTPGHADRSEMIRRIKSTDPLERMPPNAKILTNDQVAALERWIDEGALWPAAPVSADDVIPPARLSDEQFLRRVSLDVTGVAPSSRDVREFVADASPNKRTAKIDALLRDDRWADRWMGYWQDALAENPTLLNGSLNTSGPFRWFLHDALRDDHAWDRVVTELIALRGDPHEGGSAGFGIAADNDSPFAAKAQILGSAFLGLELQCARCHDAPFHTSTQRQLFSLAAMLSNKSMTVPKTSRVPAAFFEQQTRASLIRVSLPHDANVAPEWPFPQLSQAPLESDFAMLLGAESDSRTRLAAAITAPWNERFAQVIVNRVWKELFGAGLVEPVHDWEGRSASHPELLKWLGREFVSHDYSLKHVTRLLLTSDAYQRAAMGRNRTASPEQRLFVSPDRRRLSAEQIVDSLFVAAGRPLQVEELTFEPDGRRPSSNRITLGRPERAWMFANLANERDRPSLSLPQARAVADILEAFGWSGARQSPRTDREVDPNVLQPGVLANGDAMVGIARVTSNSELAQIASSAASPAELVDELFLRFLSRTPSAAEREPLVALLANDFDQRLLPADRMERPEPPPVLPRVTWSNHLRPEATTVAQELERRARMGPPPDPRFLATWRERLEDVVWSLANLPEFVWSP